MQFQKTMGPAGGSIYTSNTPHHCLLSEAQRLLFLGRCFAEQTLFFIFFFILATLAIVPPIGPCTRQEKPCSISGPLVILGTSPFPWFLHYGLRPPGAVSQV